MTLDTFISESAQFGSHYANYQQLAVGEALYDAVICGSKAPVVAAYAVAAGPSSSSSTLVAQIAGARQMVNAALGGSDQGTTGTKAVDSMRKEIDELRAENAKLTTMMNTILQKMAALELRMAVGQGNNEKTSTPPAKAAAADDDDDDEIDLFGSDSEVDEEAEKLKQERLAAYAAKKAKKPGPIAKSSILFDVKPWDDETDMKAMEESVRSISQDGLLWGASKLVPVGYGIKKLQICAVVEDDKVGVEELSEKIAEDFEDYVQSVDIAAFQKI